MSVLRAISQTVSKTSNKDEILDKISTLNFIEELSDTLKAVEVTYQDPLVMGLFTSIVKEPRPTSDLHKTVKSVYDTLFNDYGPRLQMIERRAPFATVSQAIAFAVRDIDLIKDDYMNIFGDKDTSMTSDDMRTSVVLVVGYIQALMHLTSWATYLLNAAAHTDKEHAPPAYQLTYVLSETPGVSNTIKEILNRSQGQTILTIIANMKNRGSDIYITTQGNTIDQYASDRDYTIAEKSYMTHFTNNPILSIGQYFMVRRQQKLERLKEIREFMRLRVSLLSIQMSDKDPNSSEYKKLEATVTRYMNLIAQHDKKIAQYDSV